MKFLIIFIAIISIKLSNGLSVNKTILSAAPKKPSPVLTYSKWISTFDKKFDNYTAAIKAEFRKIYEENVKLINEFRNKNVSFTLGVNSLTHLSPDEFEQRYLGAEFPDNFQPLKPSLMGKPKKNKINDYTLENLPDEFDWRDHVDMQSVLNQKKCGGCWAFSAMALLGKT